MLYNIHSSISWHSCSLTTTDLGLNLKLFFNANRLRFTMDIRISVLLLVFTVVGSFAALLGKQPRFKKAAEDRARKVFESHTPDVVTDKLGRSFTKNLESSDEYKLTTYPNIITKVPSSVSEENKSIASIKPTVASATETVTTTPQSTSISTETLTKASIELTTKLNSTNLGKASKIGTRINTVTTEPQSESKSDSLSKFDDEKRQQSKNEEELPNVSERSTIPNFIENFYPRYDSFSPPLSCPPYLQSYCSYNSNFGSPLFNYFNQYPLFPASPFNFNRYNNYFPVNGLYGSQCSLCNTQLTNNYCAGNLNQHNRVWSKVMSTNELASMLADTSNTALDRRLQIASLLDNNSSPGNNAKFVEPERRPNVNNYIADTNLLATSITDGLDCTTSQNNAPEQTSEVPVTTDANTGSSGDS